MENKLNALLTLVQALKQAQNDSQWEVVQKLKHLENDVVRNQKGTV